MVWWKRIIGHTDGSQDGLRLDNDTAKLLTLFGQTHLQLIILEVVSGKIEGYGWNRSSNKSIDGVSLKTYDAAMTNPVYRTMWEHTAMSYRMSDL